MIVFVVEKYGFGSVVVNTNDFSCLDRKIEYLMD